MEGAAWDACGDGVVLEAAAAAAAAAAASAAAAVVCGDHLRFRHFEVLIF
jgi:hypothetical protein